MDNAPYIALLWGQWSTLTPCNSKAQRLCSSELLSLCGSPLLTKLTAEMPSPAGTVAHISLEVTANLLPWQGETTLSVGISQPACLVLLQLTLSLSIPWTWHLLQSFLLTADYSVRSSDMRASPERLPGCLVCCDSGHHFFSRHCLGCCSEQTVPWFGL